MSDIRTVVHADGDSRFYFAGSPSDFEVAYRQALNDGVLLNVQSIKAAAPILLNPRAVRWAVESEATRGR